MQEIKVGSIVFTTRPYHQGIVQCEVIGKKKYLLYLRPLHQLNATQKISYTSNNTVVFTQIASCCFFDIHSLANKFVKNLNPLNDSDTSKNIVSKDVFYNGFIVKYNPTNEYFQATKNVHAPTFILDSDRSKAFVFKSTPLGMGLSNESQFLNPGKSIISSFSIFLQESKITREMITIEEVKPYLPVFSDETPLNERENKSVFLQFGEIRQGSIEDIYHVEGIGSALANQSGIFFIKHMSFPVKNLGDLKKLHKIATGNDLQPKQLGTAHPNAG